MRSQRTAKWGDSVHCCGYYCYDGYCFWNDWNNESGFQEWQGSEGLGGIDGTIGLLLDLNEGTLSVFKNGRRLGVMKDGLGGEYVWFVSVYSGHTISVSISMFKGLAPN